MTEYAWLFVGVGLVLIVVLGIGSTLTSRGYSFSSGRVQGVIGLMGSGKSLFVVQRVLIPASKSMSKKRGLHCVHTGRKVKRLITNFAVDLPYDAEVVLLDGSRIWDHLVELGDEFAVNGQPRLDAIVIIDEAHLFIPSAKVKVAQKAAFVCSMARKYNAEIWWVTQSEMKVHKRLRDDSQFVWKVGRWKSAASIIIGGPSKMFAAQSFEPENLRRATATAVDRRFYRLSKAAIAAYNSYELIVPDAEMDVSMDSLSRRENNLRLMPGLEMTKPPTASTSPVLVDGFASADDVITG